MMYHILVIGLIFFLSLIFFFITEGVGSINNGKYHTLTQRTQQARRSRYATGLQRHDSCYKQQALVRLPA